MQRYRCSTTEMMTQVQIPGTESTFLKLFIVLNKKTMRELCTITCSPRGL